MFIALPARCVFLFFPLFVLFSVFFLFLVVSVFLSLFFPLFPSPLSSLIFHRSPYPSSILECSLPTRFFLPLGSTSTAPCVSVHASPPRLAIATRLDSLLHTSSSEYIFFSLFQSKHFDRDRLELAQPRSIPSFASDQSKNEKSRCSKFYCGRQ